MKLDDGVCRGSLIIHRGIRYAVVGSTGQTRAPGWKTIKAYRIINIDHLEKALADGQPLLIDNSRIIFADTSVDLCFPGIAYQLPDFIL